MGHTNHPEFETFEESEKCRAKMTDEEKETEKENLRKDLINVIGLTEKEAEEALNQ